jgi:hypothetical protein
VQARSRCYSRRNKKFFSVGLRHESLGNMMLTNHALMLHYHYSLSELENMLPWQRKIYVELVAKFVKEENERQEKQHVR